MLWLIFSQALKGISLLFHFLLVLVIQMVFIVFIYPQMTNMPGPDNLVVAVRDVSFCHPVPIYLSRAFWVFVRFEKELVQKSLN